MNCAIRPSTPSFSSSNPIPKKASSSSIISKFQSLPPKPFISNVKPSSISITHKTPIYISHLQDFGGSIGKRNHEIVCNAYEADHSQPLEIKMDLQSEAGQKMKIGLYFATWWSLNVVFNIYNKKVLNAFPFPWLTSTLSLAAGSLIMLVSWGTKMVEPPKTDVEFWKTLFPWQVALRVKKERIQHDVPDALPSSSSTSRFLS